MSRAIRAGDARPRDLAKTTGSQRASRSPRCEAIQGADLAAADSLAAVAKHFCAYSPVTAGREYASVDISDRTLREVHLPAFAAAVAAGVVAIMPAFTDFAGIPMTAHVPLLRNCLRDELGFRGVLISDYNAIAELIRHGVAEDLPEAAALALKAGVDIDMMSDGYRKGLPIALERGRVVITDIDESVWRVLQLKERLGLFDDPYRRGAGPESVATLMERRRIARSIATRAIVLLRNQAEVLPLSPAPRRLAVIGPLADAAGEMGGPWAVAGEPAAHISVLAGLRAALAGSELRYAPGVAIDSDDGSGIAAAVNLCDGAEAVLLCLGEAASMSGEAASRADPGLPGRQLELARAVIDRARARRLPVVTILFSGRPLIVPWLAENVDALLAAWFLGSEAGNALADVLTGRASPSGRTPMSWPRVLGQVPVFFGQRPSGRPYNPEDHYTSKYLDTPNAPLYPFGFGLSYGRFQYSDLRVTPPVVGKSDIIEAVVRVANGGRRRAEETVFLFAHDKFACVTRPLLELKGFAKISLGPGESGTVTIRVPAADLCFAGLDLEPVFESGEVEILVGPNADRSQLHMASVQLRA